MKPFSAVAGRDGASDPLRPTPRLRLASLIVVAAFARSLPAAAFSWIVPGVANTRGASNEFFGGTCIAVNPEETRPAIVSVSVIRGLGQLSLDPTSNLPDFGAFSIPPHGSFAFWPRSDGTGALRIRADRAIGLFCRLQIQPYPILPSFPYLGGGNLPVVEESQLLAAGEIGHAIWVSHVPPSPGGERTNVGVVFPDPDGGAATVTLFDDRGTILGTRSYQVSVPAFLQESLNAYTSRPVPVGRIELKVTRGRASGYSGVMTDVASPPTPFTSDVTVFSTDRLSPEGIDAVTSGVSYTEAWRTDVRLANPGREVVLVTADLIAESREFSPPRVQWTISAGQTVQIKNILQSSFSAPSGTSGAIVWRSAAPVIVSARTGWPSREDYVPGFSSGILATTPLRCFRTAADGPAAIGGLMGGSLFVPEFFNRFIVAAGPSGADYELEQFDNRGVRSGLAHDHLPPWSWKQIDSDRLVGPLVQGASLLVTVRAGSLDAQVSVTQLRFDPFFFHSQPPGSGAPAAGPIPMGAWGSPDGAEGLRVTEAAVFVERHCEGGVFTQPLQLDPAGRFETTGIYRIEAGAAFSFGARFSGQTDGHVLALAVFDEEAPHLSIRTGLYTLGKPYTLPADFCPIEY